MWYLFLIIFYWVQSTVTEVSRSNGTSVRDRVMTSSIVDGRFYCDQEWMVRGQGSWLIEFWHLHKPNDSRRVIETSDRISVSVWNLER